jgi:methylamine utilization protein MauE
VSRARGIVLGALSGVYAGMWLFAATTKVLAPLPAYEFVGRVIPPGPVAKAVIVLAIGAEGALGTAMLVRAIGAARGFVASSAGLAVAVGSLLVVRSKADGLLPCGCYGDAFRSSIDQELTIDAVLLALALAAAAWELLSRRGAAPERGA